MFDDARQTNRSLSRIEGFPISLGAVIGDIGLELGVDRWGLQRLFHVTDHIERFVVDKDEIGGVLRRGRGFRDYSSDGIARHQHLPLDQRIAARQVASRIRRGRHYDLSDVLRRDDRPNTGDLIGFLDVNARYHCVGKRGANDGEMESPGRGDVVYVPGSAGDQGPVLRTLRPPTGSLEKRKNSGPEVVWLERLSDESIGSALVCPPT